MDLHRMKELEKMGLIERKRQGMGKPSFIYVKNILSCPEAGLKRFRNQTSGGLENKLQEVGKSNPNHTDYSQTDNNETNLSYPTNDVSDHKEADAIRKREDYHRYFRGELGIDELKAEYPSNADMIEELFELIVDTVCSSRAFIRIGKENLPAEIVRSRMMKLNAEHIRYLISCLNENTTKIRDIRQYLLTALYNAPATISSYYNQLVQHDIPQLLDMVDHKQLAFNPAVELSYLKKEEQEQFLEAMEYAQAAPSLSQAQRVKKLSQSGECTLDAMCDIMDEVKKGDLDRITIRNDVLKKYFPKSYTPKQMEDTIIRLLEQWQKKRQRSQER